MRVVSLFDGMCCGRLSLEKSGIPVTAYLASEINKHAIHCSSTNFPDTVHLGDVTKLTGGIVRQKAKGPIDLLIGGSPCQDLSGLGSGEGLEGNKSGLFYNYFGLHQELPEADFLLENVVPKKDKWAHAISKELGVEPVLINSSEVMPYSRPRLYWANFDIKPITPVKRSFADFIDFTSTENTLSDGWHEWWARNEEKQLKKQYSRIVHRDDQGICMTARQYASWNGNFIPTPDGRYRKPTRKELALLVGAPVNYFDCVSQRQAEEMTGNGWTIPVITHILNCWHEQKLKAQQLKVKTVTNATKGAYITHEIRVSKSEKKITEAINQLTANGAKVTKTAVANITGIRREHLSRRYQHIFNGKAA